MPKQNKGAKAPLMGSVVPNPGRKQVQYKNVGARAVTDPVCGDVTSSTSPYSVPTGTDGSAGGKFILSPVGLKGLNTSNSIVTIEPPHLPWLRNTAANFLQYRVTRATLIVASALGSTTPGSISIVSSPDLVDTLIAPNSSGDYVVGGTQVSLASLASKNARVPLRVDSAWKKVSNATSLLVGTSVVNNASGDDLMFVGFAYRVFGGPASTGVCTFYVEYDVEFKGVVGTGLNA